MSSRTRSPATQPLPAPATVVMLCRGCCCGTSDKHPDVDHEAQERALSAVTDAQAGVELRLVDCLDECDRSNVVVIRRSHRAARERDTWLGGLLTDRASQALADWLEEGATAPLPNALAGLRFRHVAPRRRARG